MSYNYKLKRSEHNKIFPSLLKNIKTLQYLQSLTGLTKEQDSLLKNLVELNDRAEMIMNLNYIPPEKMSDQPVENRVAPINVSVVPNLHYDNDVLSYSDVRDILAYILERDSDESYQRLLNETINTRPDTFATKIVDYIGTLLYGPNNYIGPGKTGNTEQPMNIIDVVTQVPALSQFDAQARAHDLLLGSAVTFKDSLAADTVLSDPGLAYAQILRPFFTEDEMLFANTPVESVGQLDVTPDLTIHGDIEPNPGPPLLGTIGDHLARECNKMVLTYCPSFYPDDDEGTAVVRWYKWQDAKEILSDARFFIQSTYYNVNLSISVKHEAFSSLLNRILLLRQGVESNPGPTWEEFKTMLDDIMKLLGRPTEAAAYYNLVANDEFIDEQNYCSRRGIFTTKSVLQDRTDQMQFQSNWIQIWGVDFADVPVVAPLAGTDGNIGFRYSLNNRDIKQKFESGVLGEGLDGALLQFAAFLATERSQNNIVNGDQNLATYSRAPRVDYGVSRLATVIMLYESWSMLMAGDENVGFKADSLMRVADVFQGTSSLYPLTDNIAPANFGAVVINAYCLGLAAYTQMLRGLVPWPGGVMPDAYNVNTVIVQPGMSPSALTYVTVASMEYPFGTNERVGNVLYYTAGNGIPAQSPGRNVGPWSSATLIDGPKYVVFFVLPNNSTSSVNVTDGLGGLFNVPTYDPLIPTPATNIAAPLISYFGVIICNTAQVTPFIEVMDYSLRFMDIKDWYASCTQVACIVQAIQPMTPYIFDVGANSMSFLTNGRVPPSVDASLNFVNLSLLTVAGVQTIADTMVTIPKYDCIGTSTLFRGAVDRTLHTPTRVTYVSKYYQDSPALVKLGIYLKMLKKETIGDSNFLSTFKVNFRILWFIIRMYADILLDMTNRFYLDRQLLHMDMMIGVAGRVINRRTIILAKLRQLHNNAFTMLCGYNPVKLADPVPDEFGSIVLSPLWLYNAFTYTAHPIVFRNGLCSYGKPDWFFGKWKPLPNIDIATAILRLAGQLIPASTANITFSGVLINLAGKTVIPEAVMFPNGKPSEQIKALVAILMTQHLLNPGVKSNWLTSSFTGIQSTNTQINNPVLNWTNEFMRYSSGTAPSDGVRNSSRPILGVSVPCFGPVTDPVHGYKLLLSFNNQGSYTSLRSCISIDGTGSSLYTFTSALKAPTDYLLELDQSPLSDKEIIIKNGVNPGDAESINLGLFG